MFSLLIFHSVKPEVERPALAHILIFHSVKPEVGRPALAHIETPPPFAIHLALDCVLG